MPCYKLMVWSRPEATPAELASTFRALARLVYREQGQFRTLENLGVRPLAWPIALPYEKFEEARLVQCTFDISPSGKSQLESFLKGTEAVLSYSHLRDHSKLAAFSRYAGKPISRRVPLHAIHFAQRH
jgi:ribosomal protein S6